MLTFPVLEWTATSLDQWPKRRRSGDHSPSGRPSALNRSPLQPLASPIKRSN